MKETEVIFVWCLYITNHLENNYSKTNRNWDMNVLKHSNRKVQESPLTNLDFSSELALMNGKRQMFGGLPQAKYWGLLQYCNYLLQGYMCCTSTEEK